MDDIALGPLLNNVGVVGMCITLVWLFITDRIVSGKRLRRTEDDRDRWQNIGLEVLRASRTAIVPAAETVDRFISALPDPGAQGSEVP